MTKRRIDVFSLLSYLLLSFVLLVVVLHFVFGFRYVVVLTDSMKPRINPGDLVVTKPISPDELRAGDVVLYRVTIGDSTYWVVHRIVDVRTDSSGNLYYLTKGDNREYIDPWRVYPDQIIGKVVLVIPRVGIVRYYISFIILFLFLLLIASLAYYIGLILVENEPVRPKSRKADLVVLRRKKMKVYYHRR